MARTTPDEERRLVQALRALNSELAGANRAVAMRLGINDSDLAVLDLLHREGPQTPTALSRRTRMAPTTMTSILRRLDRLGWIERRPNDEDLRSFTIHARSIERLTSLYRPANDQFVTALAVLDAPAREQVIGFLEDAARVVRERADDLAPTHTAHGVARDGEAGRRTH